jgi:hypothetical protein
MSYANDFGNMSKKKIPGNQVSVPQLNEPVGSDSILQESKNADFSFFAQDRPQNIVHVSELHSLFKNPKQFMWLFGVELEYHLPPKNYITWPYMIKVIKGEKVLVKSNEITLTTQLPRFEQLSMKRVWPMFSEHEEVRKYMPILSDTNLPPRQFFFQILHSKFPDHYDQLIEHVKNERTKKSKKKNRVISANPELLEEIKSLRIWTNMASSRMSKRVMVNPSKRKRTVEMDKLFKD